MTRRLTASDVLDSWRVHAEIVGGHLPSQTIQLVSELQDIADVQQSRQRVLPSNVISPDGVEPRWLGRLRRLTGRG